MVKYNTLYHMREIKIYFELTPNISQQKYVCITHFSYKNNLKSTQASKLAKIEERVNKQTGSI